MDTIVGISTPIGCGAISIVRLSGEGALSIALHFFSAKSIKNEEDIQPNKMYLGVFNAKTFQDKCMLVLFKKPKSYTGEDIVELHLHGGTRLTNNVFSALVKKGARPAAAGEFTKRAFFNEKISLSEAEGISGVINAESEAELNAAYQLMQGQIGKKIKDITDKLLEAITIISAALDYPEEMSEEANLTITTLRLVKKEMEEFILTADTGKFIKNGINVAILGRPNVGKSSLLNSMLQKDRAIVTDIAGTTRDIISESLVYKGIKINILDTAGIRDKADTIEYLGIQKALEAGDRADIVIYLIDITADKNEKDQKILSRYKDKKLLEVYNKIDLQPSIHGDRGICISAKKDKGVTAILDKIVSLAESRYQYGEILTEERHIDAMNRANKILEELLKSFDNLTEDCRLIDLNNCYRTLMEIEGIGATEKIIDNIFSKFCVGK